MSRVTNKQEIQESSSPDHLVLLLLLLLLEAGLECKARIAIPYLLVLHHMNTLDVHLHSLEHFLGINVHIDSLLLQGRHLRDEVQTTLSLLLLELQGNSTHRSSLDSLHQMLFNEWMLQNVTVTYPAILLRILLEGKSAHSSTIYKSSLKPSKYSLVVLEVQSQLLVVLLNDVSGGLLDSLSTHTTLYSR